MHTYTVATLLGNSFASMAKLAVVKAALPHASTDRITIHITMKVAPLGTASRHLKDRIKYFHVKSHCNIKLMVTGNAHLNTSSKMLLSVGCGQH